MGSAKIRLALVILMLVFGVPHLFSQADQYTAHVASTIAIISGICLGFAYVSRMCLLYKGQKRQNPGGPFCEWKNDYFGECPRVLMYVLEGCIGGKWGLEHAREDPRREAPQDTGNSQTRETDIEQQSVSDDEHTQTPDGGAPVTQ